MRSAQAAQDIADTIVDASAYGDRGRIDEAFLWLRREASLSRVQPRGHDAFWAVTRHADIQKQNNLFNNGDRPSALTTIEGERRTRELTSGSPHTVRSLVQMDNPDHFAYRRLTQDAFLRQKLKAFEPRIRQLARETVERMARIKVDPGLIAGQVEESIRWETPVKHFMRTATADTELTGRKIDRGDWLMLCHPSGNRDEAAFEEPYRCGVGRTPNRHVAFGYGPHVCLGQHRARMEMRILWEELLPGLSRLDLDGAPTRWNANFVSGPKSAPIRYAMQ